MIDRINISQSLLVISQHALVSLPREQKSGEQDASVLIFYPLFSFNLEFSHINNWWSSIQPGSLDSTKFMLLWVGFMINVNMVNMVVQILQWPKKILYIQRLCQLGEAKKSPLCDCWSNRKKKLLYVMQQDIICMLLSLTVSCGQLELLIQHSVS